MTIAESNRTRFSIQKGVRKLSGRLPNSPREENGPEKKTLQSNCSEYFAGDVQEEKAVSVLGGRPLCFHQKE